MADASQSTTSTSCSSRGRGATAPELRPTRRRRGAWPTTGRRQSRGRRARTASEHPCGREGASGRPRARLDALRSAERRAQEEREGDESGRVSDGNARPPLPSEGRQLPWERRRLRNPGREEDTTHRPIVYGSRQAPELLAREPHPLERLADLVLELAREALKVRVATVDRPGPDGRRERNVVGRVRFAA